MNETVANCELSVVITYLNETDTIGTCVAKALRSMQEAGIAGEVIVSDNGSADGSIEIAKNMGARATMIDRERANYERWLGQSDQILQLLRTQFDPEQQSIAWGKLTFVERPHHPAAHEMKERSDLKFLCHASADGGMACLFQAGARIRSQKTHSLRLGSNPSLMVLAIQKVLL